MRKLLIIGTNSIHLNNFFQLIKDRFDYIEIVTDSINKKLSYDNTPINIINFSARNPLLFYKSFRSLISIVKRFRPDIIHSQQIATNSFLAVKAGIRTNTPVVVTAWGSDVLLTPSLWWPYRKMVVYVLRKAAFFTADSVFVEKKMIELANQNIEITQANFATIEINNTDSEKENIIYSNRQLAKLYRIDRIIKAFAQFLNNNKNQGWRLIIAGDGEDKKSLLQLADSLNISSNIEFVGWLNSSENKAFYQKARVFVSVPESDGTSISLIEALGAGCIPVLSNIPANLEWVQDGINGVIVQDADENFFEKAIQLDEKQVRLLNREISQRKGTFEANQEAFMSVYEKIFNAK